MSDRTALTFALWLPLFVVAMVMAAWNGFDSLWLFALAIGLPLWSFCDSLMITIQHVRS